MTDFAGSGQDFYASPFGSARVQNRVLQAADIVHRERLGRGTAGRQSIQSCGIVTIRNSTGLDLRRGEVIDLSSAPLTGSPAREHPWFDAAVPNEQRVSAILLEAVPAGERWAKVRHPRRRQSTVQTNASHPD